MVSVTVVLRRRQWLAVLGAALVLVSVLPPLVTLAHRYIFAESLQFALSGLGAPALIVLGAPWRMLWLARGPGRTPAGEASGRSGPLDRLAGVRRQRTSFLRAAGFLAAFVAVGVAWRLPPVMDAVARHPALVAAELVTLLVAGTGLWLELVGSPPLRPRLPHPQRAAVAALAMWSTWIAAYVLGLANGAVFHAYDPAGSGLSPVADQEITAGLVWAVAGVSFVPVVFASLLAWLKDSDDPDEELQRIVRDDNHRVVVRGWARPRR
jgi:cytochrome c oxidase assembly factor CtaG